MGFLRTRASTRRGESVDRLGGRTEASRREGLVSSVPPSHGDHVPGGGHRQEAAHAGGPVDPAEELVPARFEGERAGVVLLPRLDVEAQTGCGDRDVVQYESLLCNSICSEIDNENPADRSASPPRRRRSSTPPRPEPPSRRCLPSSRPRHRPPWLRRAVSMPSDAERTTRRPLVSLFARRTRRGATPQRRRR